MPRLILKTDLNSVRIRIGGQGVIYKTEHNSIGVGDRGQGVEPPVKKIVKKLD